MTLLARTDDHTVEYEDGLLTIARHSDGKCLAFRGRRVAGEFRDCLRTHSAERVIQTYVRIAGPDAEWQPLYKPGFHHAAPAKRETP